MDALPPEFFILVVGVFSAIIGGLFVWIVLYFSGWGKSKQRPRPVVGSEDSGSADEQELLCVLRTKKGRPDVFVQGRRYRHLREITDPQTGHDTVEALKAVLTFAEGWLPTAQPSPPQPPPSKPAVDEEAFLGKLRESDLFPAPKPSRFTPPPSRPPSSSLPPLAPPADQINDLIQQRLQKWPDLVSDKVSLSTGPDGRLLIRVGLQSFRAVSDIPNSKVRALIQDAIREWESG